MQDAAPYCCLHNVMLFGFIGLFSSANKVAILFTSTNSCAQTIAGRIIINTKFNQQKIQSKRTGSRQEAALAPGDAAADACICLKCRAEHVVGTLSFGWQNDLKTVGIFR